MHHWHATLTGGFYYLKNISKTIWILVMSSRKGPRTLSGNRAKYNRSVSCDASGDTRDTCVRRDYFQELFDCPQFKDLLSAELDGVTVVEAIVSSGPSTRPNRVLVCVVRTLNPIGQARVTLSSAV